MGDAKQLKFGWGNLWICLSIFFGISFPVSMILPAFYGEPLYILANIIIGLPCLIMVVSAIGLLRRKIYGLFLTFLTLALNSLGGLAMIIIGILGSQMALTLQGFFLLLISISYFVYFMKRRSWFL